MLTTLFIYMGVSAILLRIPVLGTYIAVVDTLIHEIGHALMSLVTGGKVTKIELFASTEGTAWTNSPTWVGRILTSAAGYPFASGMSFVFLYLIKQEDYTLMIIVLLAFLLLGFIFWLRNIGFLIIRNLYGIFWLLTFSGLFGGLLYVNNPVLTQHVLLFLTAILFVQSIISAFVIMKLSFKKPKDAGDATNLGRSIIIIPTQVWGRLKYGEYCSSLKP